MRHGLALVALLLPLGGCVVPPQPIGYGYGYGQPGYAQPGYPAGDYGYPGYAYNDGSPTLFVEGATVPLIYYGGGWGYWDGYRRWHGAPDRIGRDLDRRHPGGAGYHPWGGGQYGNPQPLGPGGGRVGGFAGGGNSFVGRPGGPPSGGGFQGGGNSFVGRPGGPPSGGGFSQGGNPSVGRPGGPPPGGGFRPPVQPQAQRAAAPAGFSHPAAPPPPPQRHREDEHR